MDKLPLRIRTSVRDKFDAPTSVVQEGIKDISSILGCDVSVIINWQILWSVLQPSYSDKETFVPHISLLVTTLLSCLNSELEQDEEWSDHFLEAFISSRGLSIAIDTCPGRIPRVEKDSRTLQLRLCIPLEGPPSPSTAECALRKDLCSLLKSPESSTSLNQVEEGWDEIRSETINSLPGVVPRDSRSHITSSGNPGSIVMQPVGTERLPNLDTLERPEHLFIKTLPYQLSVARKGVEVVIQGSHQPSLELLGDYFRKWARKNPQYTTQPPYLDVSLKESPFGMGTCFDSVILKPSDGRKNWVDVNPAFVLAFVQGVLGYRLISSDVGGWYFTRETAFVS